MSAVAASVSTGSDSLASLARLKQVETDNEVRLRSLRGQNDHALADVREETDAQIQAARVAADREAGEMLDRARADADAEAQRIVAAAKAALAQKTAAGSSDLTGAWDDILQALFGEFR